MQLKAAVQCPHIPFTGRYPGNIRASADRVVEQVSDISSAMREQSSASSLMAQQVERVAQMSEESSETATKTADEGRHLLELSQSLDQAIRRYRV